MPGTSRSDWLMAMAFAYPLKQQPEVTWDNLEVRLALHQVPACKVQWKPTA
jgi:hypothetical protein